MASTNRDPRLEQLRRDLVVIRRSGLARQIDMAIAVGVDQETVSKAKTGRLKRWTEATAALQQYANMLLEKLNVSERIQRKARAFLAAGGQEDQLCAIIDAATDLVARRRSGPST